MRSVWSLAPPLTDAGAYLGGLSAGSDTTRPFLTLCEYVREGRFLGALANSSPRNEASSAAISEGIAVWSSESVMSIRGGAFDTYFENHATCHYQSGEQALSRRPNIGFRLALPMRDLEACAEAQPEQSVDGEPIDANREDELAATN